MQTQMKVDKDALVGVWVVIGKSNIAHYALASKDHDDRETLCGILDFGQMAQTGTVGRQLCKKCEKVDVEFV